MNADELDDLAERAWNESNGDVMTAVIHTSCDRRACSWSSAISARVMDREL
jgi:hypothetical protein